MFNAPVLIEPFHAFTAPKAKSLPVSVRRPGNYRIPALLTSAAAEAFSTIGRGRKRRLGFEAQMDYVNSVAGGEPRKIRRLMARARSRRVVNGEVLA